MREEERSEPPGKAKVVAAEPAAGGPAGLGREECSEVREKRAAV